MSLILLIQNDDLKSKKYEITMFSTIAIFHGIVIMLHACLHIMPTRFTDEWRKCVEALDNGILILGVILLGRYVTNTSCHNFNDCVPDLFVQTWWSISIIVLISRWLIYLIYQQYGRILRSQDVDVEPEPDGHILFVNRFPLMDPNPEQCSICLEVDETLQWRLLPCSHFFHAQCVDVWLIRRGTCPTCRFTIYGTM